MKKEEREKFMNNLNKAIDHKIAMIDAGKMEPVPRFTKFDFALSAIISLSSLVALILAYNFAC